MKPQYKKSYMSKWWHGHELYPQPYPRKSKYPDSMDFDFAPDSLLIALHKHSNPIRPQYFKHWVYRDKFSINLIDVMYNFSKQKLNDLTKNLDNEINYWIDLVDDDLEQLSGTKWYLKYCLKQYYFALIAEPSAHQEFLNKHKYSTDVVFHFKLVPYLYFDTEKDLVTFKLKYL